MKLRRSTKAFRARRDGRHPLSRKTDEGAGTLVRAPPTKVSSQPMPTLVDALARADALQQAGDPAGAERCYREILAAEPRQFDAIHGLSVLEAQRGRFEDALHLVQQALELEPASIAALITYGNVLQALNRPLEALAVCDRILAIEPASALALYNRGNVLLELNRHAEALEQYERVLALMPDNAPALYNRGYVLQHFKRYAEALASYEQVLALIPDNVATLHNRGAALQALKRHAEALASFEQALQLAPDDVEVLNNRGTALYELKRYEEALASHDQALALAPDFAEAWSNRADVLLDLQRTQEALDSWDRALAIKPDLATAANNRGHALLELERHAEALASYAIAVALEPDYEYLKGTIVHTKMQCCDWHDLAPESAQLVSDVRSGKPSVAPFTLLSVTDSASDQLRCARLWVDDKCPAAPVPVWNGTRYRHDRIRLAYLSADLRDHPVAYLLAGLFERHDRSRFETIAISFGNRRCERNAGAPETRIRALHRCQHQERRRDCQPALRARDRHRGGPDGLHHAFARGRVRAASGAGPGELSGFSRDHGRRLHRLHRRGPLRDPRRTAGALRGKDRVGCRKYSRPTTAGGALRRARRRVPMRNCPSAASCSARSTTRTKSRRPSSTSGCGCWPGSKAAC